MKDLFSYTEKFKNIDFRHQGLTEVDNVIFSRLAYLDFNNYTGKTIKEAAAKYTADKSSAKNMLKTKELLDKLAGTERFGKIIITDSSELVSENRGSAFYAVTFRLAQGLSYIAFRGTDEKITGIYEDAELAYRFPVPSQITALNYVKKAIEATTDRIYIGGHSKGGNLALFSFVFLNSIQKERIIKVFNNDGPGFPKELVKLLFKPDLCEKIINLAPEDSIVGRMLDTGGKYKIIKSTAIGAGQHNVFTWNVNGAVFESAEKFSLLSEYVEDTLTAGLNEISDDEMKKAADTIYRIAMNSQIKTTKDIHPKNYKSIIPALIQIANKETNASDEISSILKILIKSLLDSIDIKKFLTYNLPEEIAEYATMDKEELRNQLTDKFRPDENGNSDVKQFFENIAAHYREEKKAREKKNAD